MAVDEYPGTPLRKTLTPGGAPTTFQLTVTNPGDVDEAVSPVLFFSEANGNASLSPADLDLHAYRIIAPGTATSGSQSQGAAVERLAPKDGPASGSFTVPAHDALSWRIVVGLKKGFPARATRLEVNVDSVDSAVRTAELFLDVAAGSAPATTPSPTPSSTATATASPTATSTPSAPPAGTTTSGTGTDANAPAADGKELARTGASGTGNLGLLAGSLIVAGAGLGVVARRRRDQGA